MSASYDPNHVTKLGELYDFLTGIWAKCKNMFAAKSDLSTVATSGSYNDLSDKPTIPAAQVQSDWNQSNSSAVDFIKNKPSIPAAQVQSDWSQTDSSAVDYIKNKPSIPTVPVQDVEYNGASVVNAQGVAEIPAPSYPVTDVTLDGASVVNQGVAALTSPTVDQTYSSSSANAQSGAAVAEAIATVKQVPASVAADEGKVLVVNSSGNAAWDPLATAAEIQAIVV